MTDIALTVFQGRAGDRNILARSAALAIGKHYADALSLVPAIIGSPREALNQGWRAELDAALPELLTLASHMQTLMTLKKRPLSATGRCAASLATLPVVMKARPDAVVVWFDAHGDLNTPETSASGYLGGMALSGPAGMWDSELGEGLDLANVILVGARSLDPAEKALIDAGKVKVLVPGWGFTRALEKAIDGRPVYVHFDCDVLKPKTVPTERMPMGGMSLKDVQKCAVAIAKNEVVGLEIAELQMPTAGELNLAPLLDALQPLVEKMRA